MFYDGGNPEHPFDAIGRRFWMEEQRYLSGSLHAKSQMIIKWDEMFQKIRDGTILHLATPIHLNQDLDAEAERLVNDEQDAITYLSRERATALFEGFEISEDWKPIMTPDPNDDQETRNGKMDQQSIINNVYEHLTSENSRHIAKRILISGAPGVGKSYLMDALGCLFKSKGINESVFTCIASTRAADLGGEYFHKLFKLGRTKNTKFCNESGATHDRNDLEFIITNTWSKLKRKPFYLANLRKINLLLIDELGKKCQSVDAKVN